MSFLYYSTSIEKNKVQISLDRGERDALNAKPAKTAAIFCVAPPVSKAHMAVFGVVPAVGKENSTIRDPDEGAFAVSAVARGRAFVPNEIHDHTPYFPHYSIMEWIIKYSVRGEQIIYEKTKLPVYRRRFL